MKQVTKRDLSIGQQGFVDRLEADQGSTIGLAENSVIQQVLGINYYNFCSRAGEVMESRLASTTDSDLADLVRVGREAEKLGRSIRQIKVGSKKTTKEELAEMEKEFTSMMARIDGGVK